MPTLVAHQLLNDWRGRHRDAPEEEGVREIERQINSEVANDRFCNFNLGAFQKFSIEIGRNDKPLQNHAAATTWLELSSGGQKITVRNLAIWYTNIVSQTNITFIDCWINHVRMHESSHATIRFKRCWIGHATFDPKSCSYLQLTGGGLLDFSFPNPDGVSPFAGSFIIDRNFYLPNRSRSGFLEGAQPYRNLRSHLMRMDNHNAASLVYRHEEAIERETDSPSNKLFSHIYGLLSDYGYSAARPMLWFFTAFAWVALLCFVSDGAVVPPSAADSLVGWRALFHDESDWGRLTRSIHLTLESAFNPLGIFGTRTLLVPRQWWLVLALAAFSIWSIACIFLFFFALRRRFRIR